MKRFNSNKVKPSSHLTPSDLRDKAHAKRVYKAACETVFNPYTLEKRIAKADKSKPLPRRDDYKPVKVRGRNGTRLSDELRALVARRSAQREAFFSEV